MKLKVEVNKNSPCIIEKKNKSKKMLKKLAKKKVRRQTLTIPEMNESGVPSLCI
jgi:hypothetical protein